MRFIPSVAVVAALVACGASAPILLGDTQAIAPRIDPVAKEAVPLHVEVALARPENVAVFFVVPGRGATLLYPADSATPTRLPAGARLLTTSLGQRSTRDTTTATPNTTGAPLPMPSAGRRQSASTVLSADSLGRLSTVGYLLLYATDDSLDYSKLLNRVTGISIPIENDAAISTVTKLIRGTTSGTGAWAAYSVEFIGPNDK